MFCIKHKYKHNGYKNNPHHWGYIFLEGVSDGNNWYSVGAQIRRVKSASLRRAVIVIRLLISTSRYSTRFSAVCHSLYNLVKLLQSKRTSAIVTKSSVGVGNFSPKCILERPRASWASMREFTPNVIGWCIRMAVPCRPYEEKWLTASWTTMSSISFPEDILWGV